MQPKSKEFDMKKALTAIALTAAMAAGSARAADLPSQKAPPYIPPPPVMTWTGFYAGLNLGGGWQERNDWNNWGWGWDWNANKWGWGWGWNANNGGNGGVVGGGQIGYNYQFNQMLVVGVEADFQGTTIGSNNNNNNWWWLIPGFWGGNGGAPRIDWYGTVTGRAGITLSSFPTLLIYGKGGFAYGDVRQAWWNTTQTGWTAGGGLEWMFMPNWSAKVEYGYHELSGGNNNGWNWGWNVNNVNNRTRFHVVRAGVNYHFNWGAPAPVLARY
jgi:outer membrane immunogenic protein